MLDRSVVGRNDMVDEVPLCFLKDVGGFRFFMPPGHERIANDLDAAFCVDRLRWEEHGALHPVEAVRCNACLVVEPESNHAVLQVCEFLLGAD